jgi:hypothetical protein
VPIEQLRERTLVAAAKPLDEAYDFLIRVRRHGLAQGRTLPPIINGIGTGSKTERAEA